MKKSAFVRRYIPFAALIFFCLAALAGILQLLLYASTPFADFFNRYISSAPRALLAKLTGWFPFSLGETLIILLPVLFAVFVIIGCRASGDNVKFVRFIASVLAAAAALYSGFVFIFAAGYRTSPIDVKLGIERRDLSADELRSTALFLAYGLEDVYKEISFGEDGFSVMPYSLDEMSLKLMSAYDKITDKYSFIQKLHTRAKAVVLSELMSYTHITGVYSYYTGEANLNVNFPDYTIPYTAAHEFAHQRGVAREDEANFVAYLVCMESDDAYIRYSGTLNLLEYVLNALYGANRDFYTQVLKELPAPVIGELNAYSSFFDKYRKNVAAKVSGAVNDTYLKMQGTAGSKSYGLVVDLAVSYILYTEENR